jgi:transcriptional regulator with XRE-family HTH domain
MWVRDFHEWGASARSVEKSVTNYEMNLGLAIKTARLSANWTSAELAERARLSPASISLIEKGERNPSMEAAQAIAEALDMPLWALMKLADEQQDKLDEILEIQQGLIKAALVIRHQTKTRSRSKDRPPRS